uniref:Putative secreted protein n=1 Tax=Ixodes ricinus TaxID=34613 RepID=A0A147BL92_IXORI
MMHFIVSLTCSLYTLHFAIGHIYGPPRQKYRSGFRVSASDQHSQFLASTSNVQSAKSDLIFIHICQFTSDICR